MLSGPIPSYIGQLTNLIFLYLSSNRFNGSIPLVIWKLKNLRKISMHDNMFSGPIPSSFGQLSNLIFLDLSSNRISGSIPQEIWKLKNFQMINMGHNILSGSISSFLGELIDLTFLDLSSNRLNGSIPLEIGYLTHLSYLDLSSNFRTGRIPLSLDRLTDLYSLNLSANQMDEMEPPDLGGLPSLSELDLSSNQLSGHILNLQLTNGARHLDLSHNQLTGPPPKKLEQLNNLLYLGLSSNYLNGPIPTGLASLPLEYLNLSHNNLSGEIPIGFTGRHGSVDLSNNAFEGQISHRSLHAHLKKKEVMLILFISLPLIAIFLALIGFMFFRWAKVKNNQSVARVIKNGDMCSIWNYDGKIGYKDIITATNDFDIRYCIGTDELAYTMVVTEKSDVYSFGVVALETIMEKHPGELLSSLASLSTQNIMLSDVLDSRLPYPTNLTVVRNIVLAAALAFACVHSEPRSPPTMLFVSQELLVCKKTLATPFRVISLRQLLNP
ncbi:hypothetical protein TEA_024146 [Camellia sinensis var. sinensis]|uniref:Serine-threonine/tyrosine-protein kinase catalytic domain-containing protein n=1 Tax=Camellia sinensis var. sinensis TaxID=542762 RepID=A0A4V3WPR1_CAMSN|nr:hypothetical protein TEA_024146 [Camellia sinensis var. sinensis]